MAKSYTTLRDTIQTFPGQGHSPPVVAADGDLTSSQYQIKWRLLKMSARVEAFQSLPKTAGSVCSKSKDKLAGNRSFI